METSFNISNLLKATFGHELAHLDIEKATTPSYNSKLGVPYYAKDANGRYYYLPVKLGGVQLPYPLIKIQGRKNIVETPLVGRQGTVKELVSIDDWRISIRGIMIGQKGQWPEDDVTNLRNLYERNEALEIENVLTAIMLRPIVVGSERYSGNMNVVITSIEFPETKGMQAVCGYSMELVSDMGLILEFK